MEGRMGKLAGRIAIVTGGSRGIGRALCERLGLEGAKVMVAAGTNLAAAQQVAAGIVAKGGEAKATALDVSVRAQVDAMVQATLEQWGQIDILVNNAAYFPISPFWEIAEEEWDRVLAVNLKGTFLCSQAVARHMMERGYGRIINISSEVFAGGGIGFAHYVASKGAVIGLTRGLARELGHHGITVNSVAPGLTVTDGARSANSEQIFALARERRSIPRDEVPEDLAGAVVFFASSDSDFVTGQTLLVGGGAIFS